MKCSKCAYEWISKSKLMFVSCPSCGLKTLNTNSNSRIRKM